MRFTYGTTVLSLLIACILVTTASQPLISKLRFSVAAFVALLAVVAAASVKANPIPGKIEPCRPQGNADICI
ncbi:hypothetical protein DFJ73DRAFT_775584 [Zopfochytrium polystomum]|nr:hypothetical protein DFJ73DRAFT_775584 [Zopfochytrium polystomum]